MRSNTALLSAAGLLASLPNVLASSNVEATNNLAVYWGQNSYGQADGVDLAQQRLSYYCANTNINIIPLAFLITIGSPTLNLASAGDKCTLIDGSTLFYCSEIEEDIVDCQTNYGKTILLSIGGATYSEGGFTSPEDAVAAAQNIWSIFGPAGDDTSIPRPFGSSVVDGFDFDFEATVSNMEAFATELRSLTDAETSKTYYFSAAPQCPYPDAANGAMLDGVVSFDFVWVQFYNNYCGLNSFTPGTDTQTNFNFETWDTWAKETSANPDVKVFLGIPANTGAAGSGYVNGEALASVITYAKTFSSFGGVMAWDMTQLYANSGFVDEIVADMGAAAARRSIAAEPIKPTTRVGSVRRSQSARYSA